MLGTEVGSSARAEVVMSTEPLQRRLQLLRGTVSFTEQHPQCLRAQSFPSESPQPHRGTSSYLEVPQEVPRGGTGGHLYPELA